MSLKYFMHSYTLFIPSGGEGWLGFPDLWSGQKPWWNWYLISFANFGEVTRVQLAKSTLLIPTWCPWDLFRFLWSVQMLKREWDAESNGKLPHLFITGKTATRFLSLQWKTCLRLNYSLGSRACSEAPALGRTLWWWLSIVKLQPRFLSLQWKTCPWAENSDGDLDLG